MVFTLNVLQVNKVSLSLCHDLCGSVQVLSNRNNWSRRLAGRNKGTSVCRWQEQLRDVLLSSAFYWNHCHAVILRNTGHYCVVDVWCMWVMSKPACVIFLHIWLFMSVRVCAHEDSVPVFLPPAYLHTDMQVIIRYWKPVVFSPHSPLHRLYPWIRGFVWFFLRLSAVHSYSGFALHFLACTNGWFFFHISLTEEMISDWERWGRNDKLIYPTSEPGLGAHCEPFQFQYAQVAAKFLFPLPPTTVQRVLINICGCFSEIFNN